jgi:hypothetical protein
MMGVHGNIEEVGGRFDIGSRTMIGGSVSRVDAVNPSMNYQERQYTDGEIVDLGFDQNGTTVAPGATVTWTVKCSSPFKPMDLVIPSNYAPFVVLTQVQNGAISFIEGGAVPASRFSEVSTQNFNDWGTLETNTDLRVTWTNIGVAPINLYMSVKGKRIR